MIVVAVNAVALHPLVELTRDLAADLQVLRVFRGSTVAGTPLMAAIPLEENPKRGTQQGKPLSYSQTLRRGVERSYRFN